ncbi:Hypothetical protein HVR_LOCUS65 [uncultured virus]|nr:Hypothetical protein HVR_LOCUS65 [uncultured virus]
MFLSLHKETFEKKMAYSISVDNITEHIKAHLNPETITVIGKTHAIIIQQQRTVPRHEIIRFMPYEHVADNFIINKVRHIITKTYTYEQAINLMHAIEIYYLKDKLSNCQACNPTKLDCNRDRRSQRNEYHYTFFIQYEDEEHDTDELIYMMSCHI